MAQLDPLLGPQPVAPALSAPRLQYLAGLFILYLAAGVTLALILFYRFVPPADALTLDSALAEGAPVALPLAWEDQADKGFLFAVDLPPTGGDLWALAIPSVRLNARVFVNGHLVGDGGSMADPVSRNTRRPLLLTLPAAVLVAGRNEIRLQARTSADRVGYLSRLYLAPASSLRPVHDRHYFLRVALPQVISLVLLALLVGVAVLAFMRPAEREYTAFAVALSAWLVHSLSYFVVDSPFSDRAWDLLMFASLYYFAVLGGVIFVHRFCGDRKPRLEQSLLLLVTVFVAVLTLLPDKAFYAAAYYGGHPVSQVIGLYGLLYMLRNALTRNHLELHLIAVAGLLVTANSLHDLSVLWGARQWQQGYTIHYAMLFLAIPFSAVMLRRFVLSVGEAEALNRTLEQRVAQARRELEASYKKLQALGEREMIGRERERIMRDMHDGMGGQLVSTLALVDRGAEALPGIELAVRSALQDLRLMIDSLDVAGEDVPTLLGMFRSRVEAALEVAGIDLRWQVGDIADVPGFGPHDALQVLRILQEAVTNVIRHSGATEVVINARDIPEPHRLVPSVRIVVEDNGCGIAPESKQGRGLGNLAKRARLLGAKFEITAGSPGTRILLVLRRRNAAKS